MPGKIENQYTTLGLSKMNLRLYIICIAAALALVGPALAANSTATVHGVVYDYDTFKPLENAVVEVNSTPSQSMVAKYGLYSFDLLPGDYNITASYQNSSVTYSASETIQIKDQGKYVRDLLLLPVYSEELMDDSELNEFSDNANGTAENSSSNTTNPLTDATTGPMASKGNSSSTNLADQIVAGPLNANYLLIALLLLFLLATGYRFSRKDKKIEENQPQKRVYRVSGTEIPGKGHATGDLSEPFKAPELKQESQLQESWVEPFETVYSTEPVADPVTEPVREPVAEPMRAQVKESLEESVTEPVKEPVNEQVKLPVKEAPEIPEEKVQAEPAEIKENSPEKGRELVESEPQKEKQGIFFEESEDKPVESPEIETPASRKKFPLPADLQEVMDIIRGQGGRITQKDLRSKLKYSEGKVSLMLADLERRELIEKFKRGRGNVVILKDEER